MEVPVPPSVEKPHRIVSSLTPLLATLNPAEASSSSATSATASDPANHSQPISALPRAVDDFLTTHDNDVLNTSEGTSEDLLLGLKRFSACLYQERATIDTVDHGELERLLAVMHRIVQHARPSDESTEADWKSGSGGSFDSAFCRLLCGMEASRCIFLLSGLPVIAHLSIRDDYIADTTYLLHRSVSLLGKLPSEHGLFSKSTTVTPKASSNSAKRSLRPGTGTSLQLLSRSIQDVLLPCEDLLANVRVEDGILDSLAGVCIGCLFSDISDRSLQLAALPPLQKLFQRSEESRESLFSDILTEIGKLSGARQSLVVDGGLAMQTFTTTILILLQSSVIKPPSDTDSQLFADDNTDHTFPPSLYKFLVAFTDKAMSARKESDSNYGKMYRMFVEDLTKAFSRVEWPAAEPLLYSLVQLFSQHLPAPNGETDKNRTANSLCIHLMGLVCRVLQEVKVQDDATPLVFPPPKAAVNPDGTPCDSDEVVMCLCNQRTDEFMLDCDECHCWYHGRCVAVTKEVAEAGVTWVCDRCQVREQILRQRQQFATIAKAVEASKLAAAECGPATPKPTKKSASKGQSKKKKKQKRDSSEDVFDPPAPSVVPDVAAVPGTSDAVHDLSSVTVEFTNNEHLLGFLQLLLNSLTEKAREDRVVAGSARQFWLRELARGLGWFLVDQSELLPKDQLAALFTAQWQLPPKEFIASRFRDKLLSPYLQDVVCKKILCKRPLVRSADRLFLQLLSVTLSATKAATAETLKAVVSVIDSNPSLIGRKSVSAKLTECLMDESKLVRAEAIQLVARYITVRPELVDHYFDTLLSCLDDAGIRVRQNVVKLIRDVIFTDSMEADGSDARAKLKQQRMLKASARLLQVANKPSEDERTKDMIKEVFEALWFKASKLPVPSRTLPPLLPTSSMSTDGDLMTPVLCRLSSDFEEETPGSALAEPVTPIRPVPSTPITPRNKSIANAEVAQSKAELIVSLVHLEGSTDWLASMVKRFIYGSDVNWDPRLKVKQAKKSSKKKPLTKHSKADSDLEDEDDDVDVNDAVAPALQERFDQQAFDRCAKLADALVSYLVALDTSKDAESKLLMKAAILTVKTFAQACPTLISNHILALLPYLMDASLADSALTLLEVLELILPHSPRLDPIQAQQLEQLLLSLLQRSKPDIVLASAACLAAMKSRYKIPSDRMFSLMRACLGQLSGSPKPEEGMARARPLYIVGAILQHFDFDMDPGFEVPPGSVGPMLEKGAIVATAFESLVEHAPWRSGPPAQAAKLREMALRAMCLMLLQYPGLARFDATVHAITLGLEDTSDDVVRWLLMSLKTLLEQQDRRIVATRLGKKGGDDDTGATGDAAEVGSLVRQLIPVLYSKLMTPADSVRFYAVGLLDLLVKQGLANPAASVSKFIALLCDPSAKIREACMAAVTGIRERYPGFIVEHSLSGVVQCFTFLHNAFGPAGIESATFEALGELYSTSLSENLKDRAGFLGGTVRKFTSYLMLHAAPDSSDDESGSHPSNVKKTTSSQAMTPVAHACLCRFLTRILASLPYKKEEEPLVVISEIGKQMHLFGGSDGDSVTSGLVAYVLSLLLELKVFLKRAYGLSNGRCLAFVPTTTTAVAKAPEKTAVRMNVAIPDFTAPPTQFDGEEGDSLLSRFRVLLGEDPSDFGYVGTIKREPAAKRAGLGGGTKRTRPTKPKSKRRKSKYGAPDSDEDEAGGADGDSEDYEG